jgi:predicted patatin/cPLA2 family phospholipase
MPPRKLLDGDYHVDGGVREIVPIEHAVRLGATKIVAVVMEPPGVTNAEGDFDKIPKILLRTLSLMIAEIRKDDIPRDIQLTVIRPEEQLIENSLRFNPVEMRAMIEKGYATVKSQIG